MPIAFALGAVAAGFHDLIFMPAASVDTVAQNVYEEMASDHAASSIPLFILKGAAIGKSRAGTRSLCGASTPGCTAFPGGLG